jgi:hypothetical protein
VCGKNVRRKICGKGFQSRSDLFLMKSFLYFLLLVAHAMAASDQPRVSRAMLVTGERSLDDRFTRLWDDNPFVLLGPTRGIYLEGYGAVLTTEINLVTAPPYAMVRPVPGKDEIAKHRSKKMERLPELKRAMRQALVDTAASLDTIPDQEQIVVVMFLSRYPWEDTSGLPVQVMMRAQKGKLLEAQRSGGASLDSAIQVEQF